MQLSNISEHFRSLRGASRTDALELLAWMVAKGILEVKVAVPCDLNRRADGG